MNEEQNINQLPKDWQTKKLGELCKQKEGLRRGPFGSAIKKEFFVPNGYKVYEQSNAIYNDIERGRYFIDEDKYQELINFNVVPGDLIVSCSGTLGRIAEIPSNAKAGVINQALLRIRLIDDIISKKYFLYFFRSAAFQKKIFDQSQGTAMSNLIGIKDFKEIELSVPSLKEQKQIVSKIEELFSEVDKGIEEIKIAQQQLKVYRQAVLKWAFEGRLTNADVAEGELPKEWKWTKLSEVSRKITDGEHFRPAIQATGIPFLSAKDVRDNGVSFDHPLYISQETANKALQRCNPERGDILIVSRGATVGRMCIVKTDKTFCLLGSVILIKAKSELSSEYLTYILKAPQINRKLISISGATAQQAIYLRDIKHIELPLPSKEEQQQIVQEIESRLSVCDKIEETITYNLKQAEGLRQSILKKAFEGKLVKEEVLVYKPRSVYFYQSQTLGYISYYSNQKGIEHGEMTIAKYAYLLDKIYKIPTFYVYKRWHLGPYPPEMKKAVKNKRFFKQSDNKIDLADVEKLLKYNNPYKDDIAKAVDELAKIFSAYSKKDRSSKTELLATVCKVVEDINSVELGAVRQSMKEWTIDLSTNRFKNKAERFSEEETVDCLKFIVEKRWDKKLIK